MIRSVTSRRARADPAAPASGPNRSGAPNRTQLAIVDEAAQLFAREVTDSARHVPVGLARLRALCEAWLTYLAFPPLPGGCFFIAALAEYDGRPGAVRNALVGLSTLWRNDLRQQARAAITAAELPLSRTPIR